MFNYLKYNANQVTFVGIKQVSMRFIYDREFRDRILTNWASFGLILFLVALYCAKNVNQCRWIYGLFFITPILGIMLTRPWKWSIYGGRFTGIALLEGVFVAFSTFWSESPNIYSRSYDFLCFSTWFCGTAWLAQKKKIDTRLIVNVLIYTGAVMAVFLMIIFYAENSLDTRMWLQGSKRFGPTNPIRIGMYYSLTTLLCFIKILDANKSRKKAVFLLLMAFNFLPVLATQSRGPLLAFVVTLVFIIFFYKVNKKIIIAILLLLVFVLGFVISNSQLHKAISLRMNDDSCRQEIWSQSIVRTIEINPWLGCGRGDRINIPVQLPQRNNEILTFSFSHNQFIDAFYVLGIVGFLLFIIFNINVALQYTRDPSLFPLFIWFIIGSLAAFTVGNSNIDLEGNWLYVWMPAGLIGAFVSQKRLREASTS